MRWVARANYIPRPGPAVYVVDHILPIYLALTRLAQRSLPRSRRFPIKRSKNGEVQDVIPVRDEEGIAYKLASLCCD
jgi:hypothetical protein